MGRKLDRRMGYLEKEDQVWGFRGIKVKTMWSQNVVENMSVSKASSP